MKILLPSIGSLAVVLLFGTTAMSAQSCAATKSLVDAGHHAGVASGEASAAGGASITASAQSVAGVAAVPVWMSGAVVEGGGNVLSALGGSTAHAGAAATHGAKKMWDFATGDAASRPALARERAVPPLPVVVRKPKDVSPAEALRSS